MTCCSVLRTTMLHNQTGSYHCLLSHIRFPSVPGRQVLLQFLVHGPLQCTDMQTAVQLPDVISQERYFGYLVNNTGCMFGHSWFQRSLVYMFHRHTVPRIQVWHPVYRHVALQLTHQYPSITPDITNANVRQELLSCGTSSKRYKWFWTHREEVTAQCWRLNTAYVLGGQSFVLVKW